MKLYRLGQVMFRIEHKKRAQATPEPKGQKLKIKGLNKFLIHNNISNIMIFSNILNNIRERILISFYSIIFNGKTF